MAPVFVRIVAALGWHGHALGWHGQHMQKNCRSQAFSLAIVVPDWMFFQIPPFLLLTVALDVALVQAVAFR
jgi:hypothetical protein